MAGSQKTITVAGYKELDKALRQFTPKVQEKIQRKGAREAAKPVAAKAREYAPKRTGDLAQSIKIKALRRSRKNKGRVGVRIVTSEKDNLFQGEQFYGAFQEFGTAYLEPHPYMGRARDECKGIVGQIFAAAIKLAIEKTANEVRPPKPKMASNAALAAAG